MTLGRVPRFLHVTLFTILATFISRKTTDENKFLCFCFKCSLHITSPTLIQERFSVFFFLEQINLKSSMDFFNFYVYCKQMLQSGLIVRHYCTLKSEAIINWYNKTKLSSNVLRKSAFHLYYDQYMCNKTNNITAVKSSLRLR